MKPGDMIRILGSPGIIAPLTQPGRLMGARVKLSMKSNSIGVVVEKSFVDDEEWLLVLFPEGTGWIQEGWGEVVE